MLKRRPVPLKPQSRGIDKQLLVVVLVLVVFGVIMVGNSSFAEAERYFNDKFYYLRQQAVWAVLGIVLFFFLANFPHKKLFSFAPLLFIANVVLLGLVLIKGIGIEALGAKRWLGVGQFVVQPSEFAKLTTTLYLARIFSRKHDLLPFLLIVGIVLALVMAQPDLGTALVIAGTAAGVYFASGAPLAYFALLVPAGVAAVLLLILASDYRRDRLLTFFNPASDPLGRSYHIKQVLIALGSGGLFGVGLGQSRQKHFFLPEAQTDSIFAIIGEELGFLGAAAVVLAFIFIVYKGFTIARGTEGFSKLLAVGITSWIGVQAFINLGAMVAIFPLTGIPLPLISYGGSSLISALAALGILLNISKDCRETQ